MNEDLNVVGPICFPVCSLKVLCTDLVHLGASVNGLPLPSCTKGAYSEMQHSLTNVN